MVKNSYRRFVAIHVIGLILSGLLFTWISRDGTLDFRFTQLFYDPVAHVFPLKNAPYLVFLGHTVLKYLTSLGLIIGILLAIISGRVPLLRPWRRALITFCVMASCSALLVVLLKDTSVHACPWDLAMYGGDAQWYPLFDRIGAGIPLGRCWPGGHASGGFAIIAGYFALREQQARWARWLLVTGLALGAIMSAVQIVRGAHFLSHNLWTLWLIWAACLAIDALIQMASLAMRYKSGALPKAESVMVKFGS